MPRDQLGQADMIFVNVQDDKAMPGRETDVRDCEWLAQLLKRGLLCVSFIRPQAIRELHDLSRYGKVLVQYRATVGNQVQKLLESANLELTTRRCSAT